MPLPRLTEVGDTALLTIASYQLVTVPAGPAVEFTFHGHPGETLTIGRMAVDGAFLRMEMSKGTGKAIEVDYDAAVELPLRFSRTAPKRGTTPLWRIEREPGMTTRATTPAPARWTEPNDAQATVKAPAPTIADRRVSVRQRYDDEAVRIMRELIPRLNAEAQEKRVHLTVNFDVNAAVSSIFVEEGKRGAP